MNLNGLLLGEVVAVALAPLPVALDKSVLADHSNEVRIPESVHKVPPTSGCRTGV